MKNILLAALATATLSIIGCKEKDCEANYYGELCFRSKTNKSLIDVYLNGSKMFTLDTMEERCVDTLLAGEHTYMINYVKLGGGPGSTSSKTVYVPQCERVVIQMLD